MYRFSFLSVLGLLTLLSPAGNAQTLSTAAPNNGSGGVFMNLTPVSLPISVTSFDVAYTGTVGTLVDVEVWTRPGSYVGFEGNSAGWTLTQTVQGVRQGTLVLSPLTLTTPILLPDGATTAVYLHAITAGGGIRYTGTAALPPVTDFANSDLALFSNVARTGAVPFGGTMFPSRAFAGNVNYMVIPEPTIGLLGLVGLVGIGCRRLRRCPHASS